jgi:methylmalonyl-CoA mutase N-terminal domain/subunit
VEQLTDEIERGVLDYLRQIDEMGGALNAVENGFIQMEIQESAYRFQKAIERDEHIIVGVNAFQDEENPDVERVRVDPAIEAAQSQKLNALRTRRNEQEACHLIGCLKESAQSDENLMPLIITGVQKNLTLGEICGALREVWGEHQPPVWG